MASPPPGYDPTVSSLPDPGAAAAPMKAMMGGGSSTNLYTTVVILGEPYRIRTDVEFPLEKEEERLLKIFLVGPEAQRKLGKENLISFFHALTHYNCEKEEGVLLNPKCEPVRAILRAALLKDSLQGTAHLEPLKKLLNEDTLKRRNHVEVIQHLDTLLPTATEGASVLDRLLRTVYRLKERYKIRSGDDNLSALVHAG